MSSLGIYFGPGNIHIVESQVKKTVKRIKIPLNQDPSDGQQRSVISDTNTAEVANLIRDALIANRIEATEAGISISGKDIIIRTFDMPVLPASEIAGAVNFEIKKYIPFKTEELIFDFYIQFDRQSKKNLVVFTGIKKEIFNNYHNVLNNLKLKVLSIEYSAFSLLRILKLAGINQKTPLAVINLDLNENDEVNFVVVREGFPLFSRDIMFVPDTQGGEDPLQKAETSGFEKLKSELRVSFDYYGRNFPSRQVRNLLFIADKSRYQSEMESFSREIGVPAQFIDIARYTDQATPFSSGFVKAYSSALVRQLKSDLKLNLLEPKSKSLKESPKLRSSSLTVGDISVKPTTIFFSALICVVAFLFGSYRVQGMKKELNSISVSRPKLITVKGNPTDKELIVIETEYKKKLAMFDGILKKQINFTQIMDVIPRSIPKGLWLTEINYTKSEETVELVLKGSIYLSDNDKELEALNGFLAALKLSQPVTGYFKAIDIQSVEARKIEAGNMTDFIIMAKGYK